MVRNQTGGNKSKHLARKHITGGSTRNDRMLRLSQCPEEMYAYVIKPYGNGMCLVMCIDGRERLCIIRNKFTGRNKRDNLIEAGSWVLVGAREWERDGDGERLKANGKKDYPKCDLLEIYTHIEREKLKTQVKIFQDVAITQQETNIMFVDSTTLEYANMVKGKSERTKSTSYQDIYDDISDEDDGFLNKKLSDDSDAESDADDHDDSGAALDEWSEVEEDDDDSSDHDDAHDIQTRVSHITLHSDHPRESAATTCKESIFQTAVDIDDI